MMVAMEVVKDRNIARATKVRFEVMGCDKGCNRKSLISQAFVSYDHQGEGGGSEQW